MILKFRKYRQTKKKTKKRIKKKTKQKTKQKIFSGGASFMPKARARPTTHPSNDGTGGQKSQTGYLGAVGNALKRFGSVRSSTRASVKTSTSSTSQQPTPQQPNPSNARALIAEQLAGQ